MPFDGLLSCLNADSNRPLEAIQEVQAHYAPWQSQRVEKSQKRLVNCRNECVNLAAAVVKLLKTELAMISQANTEKKQTDYLGKLTQDISQLS